MGQRKADLSIGKRMSYELLRIFPNESIAKISKKMGCSHKLFYEWQKGITPSPIFLSRLHYLGGDPMYVLTGTRYAFVRYLAVNSGSPLGYRKMIWNGHTFEEDAP